MKFSISIEKKGVPQKIQRLLRTKKSNFWMGQREKLSLEVYRYMAKNVPAYKKFLNKQKINSSKIITWKQFQALPIINKNNYLRFYTREQLFKEGTLSNKSLIFAATSGSSGKPFYFGRSEKLDIEYSLLIENFLNYSTHRTKGPTLVIVAFGMGVWIAGIITCNAFHIASKRNKSPISFLPTGVNKREVFNALRELSPSFKQTILVGYPPFIKDIIDESPGEGINLKKLNIRLLFAAESFSEKYREYMMKKVGISNPYRDTLNIYGSADIGAMAFETPLSILIRRLALKDKKLFKSLFSDIEKIPTLAQFNPMFVNFESHNGEILITGDSAIPFTRYAIGDQGGVLSYEKIKNLCEKHGISITKEIQKARIKPYVSELPFVYVYERTDLSTSIYGIQIYPQMIREALTAEKVAKHVTGKLILVTKLDKQKNQYLEINVEMQKDTRHDKKALKNIVHKEIFKTLRHLSSEFREITNHFKNKIHLDVILWPAGDPTYFQPGTKQKWVKK